MSTRVILGAIMCRTGQLASNLSSDCQSRYRYTRPGQEVVFGLSRRKMGKVNLGLDRDDPMSSIKSERYLALGSEPPG